MSDEDQDRNSCSMVGLLGILIQVGLGGLSFSVLIIKRYFQNPKRPWKIWAFDASKQIISQLIAHFINLTISIALAYDRKNSDQCLWYFVTNVFDNTMGVFICIVLLQVIQNFFRKRRRFELVSGNYYRKLDPLSLTHKSISQKQRMKDQSNSIQGKSIEMPIQNKNDKIMPNRESLISDADSRMQAFNHEGVSNLEKQNTEINPDNQFVEDNHIYIVDYKAWILQLVIWNGIVIIGKCALFGIQFGLQKQLQDFSIMILGWIQDYPIFQLLLVIVIIPVIMNALAYWVQDNFLMKKQKQSEEKDLLEENLKENGRVEQQFNSDGYQIKKKDSQMNQNEKQVRSRKQSDFQSNGNRFEFHDDFDVKDQQNPDKRFQNFDKFGKFAF